MLANLKKELEELKNLDKAKTLQKFFKTGRGEYGEGDIFLGLSVGEQRRLSKKYREISLEELEELLSSKIHEYRLVSLLIMVEKYKKNKEEIVNFYLKNIKNINNWDLVDLSSPKILGNFLLDKDKSTLYKLARSSSVWERRIAIISTYGFIKNNQFSDTLKISEILLKDKCDLIHKAVGWMLREIGKRDLQLEEEFLKKHYKKMPRTMLRYAIEKFDEGKRKFYMKK